MPRCAARSATASTSSTSNATWTGYRLSAASFPWEGTSPSTMFTPRSGDWSSCVRTSPRWLGTSSGAVLSMRSTDSRNNVVAVNLPRVSVR